jgi:hypothetical protein
MLTPDTVAWTAKVKMAPTAMRKMLTPIPMVDDSCRLGPATVPDLC